MKLLVRASLLIYLVLAIGCFGASMSLLSAYVFGDQLYYHRFYELINGSTLLEGALIARNTIDSSEPIAIFILWLGSNLGVEKNTWISFLNVAMMLSLYALLRKHGAPWYAIFLMLSNFYVIVLMTSAERLKMAYILIFLAFILEGRGRIFFAAVSPLAHLQSFILLGSIALASVADSLRRILTSFRLIRKGLKSGLLIISIGFGLLFFLWEGVYKKGIGYASVVYTLGELSNFLALFTLGLFVARKKFRFVLAMAPLGIAVLRLGGLRVNMIAVSVFIGFMLFERRLTHPAVIFLLIYFSAKSIPFVSNIYKYGDGFGGFLF